MKDMMIIIYDALKTNLTIAEQVTNKQIKFFEVPETLDTTKPFIVIDTLSPQKAAYFAANKEMSQQMTYQINIESQNRMTTKAIAKAVKDSMRELGFGQLEGGLDTYFPETKRFVDARRYRINTKIHDTDY